ncbi:PilZ domain-containing protein [Desulfovibrio sp. OttesenSCG-928-C06]|nr:PilZ domain-containing protein [Desulfovibrio sp. OttesenSCG-928-C06]
MSNQFLSEADKRSYSRVPVYFQGLYRHVSEGEPQICPRQNNVEDSKNLIAELNAGGTKVPSALIRYLSVMNGKLDSILSILQKESFQEFFPNKLMVIEVSASGVLVQSDVLQVGEQIELVMYLGEFPPRIASAIGRIIRPGRPDMQDKPIFAVQFTSIRESDREELVRFVFKEDRERIRSERLK